MWGLRQPGDPRSGTAWTDEPVCLHRVVQCVAPPPFVALSLLLDGPATVWAAVQHLSLKSMAAVAYIAWISTLLGFGLWTYLMSRYPRTA